MNAVLTKDPAPPAFDRRRFFKLLGGGVAVLLFSEAADAQRSGGRGSGSRPVELSAWIHLGEDGKITVFTGKVEVGQNIRTSLSQVVAEELAVPLDALVMIMGDTDLVPYDAGTFGSRTTPDMASHLRRAAATARLTLLELAAKQLGVEAASLSARDGRIEGHGASLTYASLAKGEKLVATIREEVPTISPADWKLAGTSVGKINGRDFVTGAHHFTSDLRRPGMVHAKILRAPAFRSRLVALDTSKAAALEGVQVHREGDFVGITAPDVATAERALAALVAEWETPPQPSRDELFDLLRRTAGAGGRGDRAGSLDEGFAAAVHRLEAAYTIDYIAHAPLEPRAAVAEWSGEKLTVWTGTQRPFGVKGELVNALGLPEDKVRVIVPDTGSGYGGKHSGDAAVEAARLAKATGKPVKLVWTREEEFTWAYFRPAGLIEVKSALDASGRLLAWEFHNYNSGPAAIGTPYTVPHRLIEFHGSDSPLRQGSYRGLASVANAFARECHMDELAARAGQDPLAFRLAHLDNPRLRAVLEAAARRFGWAATASASVGRGLACGIDKGGYIATCAEVIFRDGNIEVTRITAAFECGAILNPSHLESQVEGSIVMGMGGALFEAIRFENGRILNPSFSHYRVPRFSDVPPIDIVLLDRKDLPSAGAGEAPILAVAPAIANAVASLNGKRLRSLPLNVA